MKKLFVIVPAVLAVAMLSGCAQRPLNEYDRAAILGASENQALQNAHDAAFGDSSTKEHKHHRHHGKHQTLDDNGVVYQDGQQGYYDASGNFHAY